LLRCGIHPIIGATKAEDIEEGVAMSELWDTKDGPRRVRRDPPTVEEAVLAAQGLTDELSEQTEIVASLMQISAEEARGAVLRMVQRRDVDRIVTRTTRLAGAGRASAAPRAVVVERRGPRRSIGR
jgi:hypothetical protein